MLDGIKKLFDWINRLNPDIKTYAIVFLLFFGGHTHMMNRLSDMYIQGESLSENYTEYMENMAVKLNEKVGDILREDKDISNILLLSYHNTTHSLQGFSYLYLTALTEKTRGYDTESHFDWWKGDHNYVYFAEELAKVHNNSYLRIDDVNNETRFPKLCRKLQNTEITSAAFYPISGIDSPIGMIVILYKDKKEYGTDYNSKNISSHIQVISSILDYQNVEKLVKSNNANRQKEWWNLLQR